MEIINLEEINLTSKMWYVLLPLILCVLDVITGYLNAWIKNDIKSVKMRSGLGKKVGELSYCILGLITYYALGTNSIAVFITSYICFMEVVSLLENCDKLGVPMPKVISKRLNNVGEIFNPNDKKEE